MPSPPPAADGAVTREQNQRLMLAQQTLVERLLPQLDAPGTFGVPDELHRAAGALRHRGDEG